MIANWALHASLASYHLIYNATRGIIVKFSLQTKRHLKLWEWSFFSQWHRRLEKKKCVYWLLSIWYGDYWPPLVSSPSRCSALTGESLELLRRLKGLSHEYIAVLGHFCAEVISRCLWPLHSILLLSYETISNKFHQGTLAIFIFWLFLQAWLKTKKKVAQFFFIFWIQLMRNLPPPNYVHVKNILYMVRVGFFEGSVYAVLIYIEHCSSVSGSILQELYWHHHSSRFPEIPCPWKCGGCWHQNCRNYWAASGNLDTILQRECVGADAARNRKSASRYNVRYPLSDYTIRITL